MYNIISLTKGYEYFVSLNVQCHIIDKILRAFCFQQSTTFQFVRIEFYRISESVELQNL